MSNPEPRRAAERSLSELGDDERAPDPGIASVASGRRAPALERLRSRVEVAARELERLRKDNILLARRIAELEARPAVDRDQAFVMFEEGEEVLRKKVETFIQAIDAHLARERASESGK